jgi:hypothetical protein
VIDFKNEKDMVLFSALHPVILMIFSDMYWYAYSKHNIKLTVTDTISTIKEDKALGRKSKSHLFGTAIDVRTRDVDAFILADIVDYINTKDAYTDHQYLSNSGVYRLAYLHNNSNGEHLHLAIHSKYRD